MERMIATKNDATINQPIKIALTDDHTMFCQAMGALLSLYAERLEVVFTANSGKQLLEHLQDYQVDVLLLDIIMPDESGIIVLRQVKQKYPEMKVIMLTSISSPEVIQETIQIGADGFLSKYTNETELVAAIESVHAGAPFYGKDIAALLNDVVLSEHFDLSTLTSREREIINLCTKGYSCCEIASRLFISVRTAETHKNSIFRKLGIHNSVELVRYAFNHGLLAL